MLIKKRKQSIITKKGNKGYTYLSSGDKLSKDDLRFEAAGTMDELSSFLGMAKSLVKDKKDRNILEKIQRDLLIIGAQISVLNFKKLKRGLTSKNVGYLENEISRLEKRFVFNNFVLAGDNLVSSSLHIARAVARRLERRVITLKNKEKFRNENILVYLNRLSDLIFLLAYRYSVG
ncbi:MAG: cob(I)yrinic acid a,c-diamide adenosyltransferase [Candidatus Omnitrophota bacterium]|nr:cob(I)yrinic acid a,c-diamide adenosyltransferase [Candidatus Omnitrophota bacterium]